MPMAYVLFRGQYDKQKDKVTANTPGVLHQFPKDAPTNRLGLAQWINSPENPLTARVTVNRFWQEIFGVGPLLGDAANGPAMRVLAFVIVAAVSVMSAIVVIQTVVGWFGLG